MRHLGIAAALCLTFAAVKADEHPADVPVFPYHPCRFNHSDKLQHVWLHEGVMYSNHSQVHANGGCIFMNTSIVYSPGFPEARPGGKVLMVSQGFKWRVWYHLLFDYSIPVLRLLRENGFWNIEDHEGAILFVSESEPWLPEVLYDFWSLYFSRVWYDIPRMAEWCASFHGGQPSHWDYAIFSARAPNYFKVEEDWQPILTAVRARTAALMRKRGPPSQAPSHRHSLLEVTSTGHSLRYDEAVMHADADSKFSNGAELFWQPFTRLRSLAGTAVQHVASVFDRGSGHSWQLMPAQSADPFSNAQETISQRTPQTAFTDNKTVHTTPKWSHEPGANVLPSHEVMEADTGSQDSNAKDSQDVSRDEQVHASAPGVIAQQTGPQDGAFASHRSLWSSTLPWGLRRRHTVAAAADDAVHNEGQTPEDQTSGVEGADAGDGFVNAGLTTVTDSSLHRRKLLSTGHLHSQGGDTQRAINERALEEESMEPATWGRGPVVVVTREWTRQFVGGPGPIEEAIKALDYPVKTINMSGTFYQQWSVMDSAWMIIAAHGSGLANILWMRPGATLVEIFPYLYADSLYQQWAIMLQLRYFNAMSQPTSREHYPDPFYCKDGITEDQCIPGSKVMERICCSAWWRDQHIVLDNQKVQQLVAAALQPQYIPTCRMGARMVGQQRYSTCQ